jgi:transcriptional regulator with PAS, ATPase and Fis domain
LKINDKVLGTIYLDNRTLTRAFSEEDRDFIDALSNLLAVAIKAAQSYSRAYQEVYQLKQRVKTSYEFPHIVGRSPKMQEVFSMVTRVAATRATVLIQGESGTGKELIANLIHNLSERNDRPFIRVNCAAIPDTLLESELFGVEEKVATGVNFREGKFKLADGGTIFLDEVGDMNLATQAKVLRVLQEREFERVGGLKTLSVDIRVIAATNKDLERLMKDNMFRHDLYYRLNTVTIPVPPLRERKEDIPLFIEFFLRKFSQENNMPTPKTSPAIVNALCQYDWPGNVRQLMNVIQRAVIFAEEGEINLAHLPPDLTGSIFDLPSLKKLGKLNDLIGKYEKGLIVEALKKTNWNQTEASNILDIPISTMTRKIQKYKIKKPKTF